MICRVGWTIIMIWTTKTCQRDPHPPPGAPHRHPCCPGTPAVTLTMQVNTSPSLPLELVHTRGGGWRVARGGGCLAGKYGLYILAKEGA